MVLVARKMGSAGETESWYGKDGEEGGHAEVQVCSIAFCSRPDWPSTSAPLITHTQIAPSSRENKGRKMHPALTEPNCSLALLHYNPPLQVLLSDCCCSY